MAEFKMEKAELIEMFYETNANTEKNISEDILERYNFSLSQWKCFVSLGKDLELNHKGIEILLDEIYAGRILLPCSR